MIMAQAIIGWKHFIQIMTVLTNISNGMVNASP